MIISLLLSVTVGHGQNYVFGRMDVPVGPGAFSTTAGDFNGDGIVDLVSANQGNNTVSVVLGKVDGGFNAPVSYATGPAPTAVVSGDFNNDGILDLAVTDGNCAYQEAAPALYVLVCDAGTVSILLGNGDGSFQPPLDYATGKNPSALAAADFNGDGKLDLAMVNLEDGTVSVLLGRGDGSFQPQVVYQVPSAQNLVIGDFNNDHKLDLVVSGVTVSTLLGNGDGTFQAPLNYGVSSQLQGSALAAADFNLDGKLDLYADGGLFLGNGDGTFVLHASYAVPNGAASATATDLNNDGKPDVVVAGQSGVSILLGNGDGSFQTAVKYAEPYYSTEVLAADVNGDGRLDLAVANSGCATPFSCSATASAATGPASISLLLGLGDGSFVGGTQYPIQAASLQMQVISADFNGDGKPDFAVDAPYSVATTELVVYLGNGDGTLQAQISTTVPSNGAIAAADLNGDGKADIAMVYTNCTQGACLPGYAAVLISNGDGTFQPPVPYATGLQPGSLVIGDFNGDGKPDLATSNSASNNISILLNNGDGTFPTHVEYSTGTSTGEIISGDFNGDGKLDLVVLAGTGVSVLLGNGDGTFQPPVNYAVSEAASLAAGDFNSDGKLDLAVTTQQDSQPLVVLLGNGDGTFRTAPPSGSASGYPAVGDFNADGKPDLIMDGAAILLGKGDGTFGQPFIVSLGSGIAAVVDINHDGVPDVVGGTGYNTPAGEIGVLLSTAFKAVAPASLNFGAQGVGTMSAPQTITISNPASVSFNITNIAASGTFSQTNDCGASLAAGAHCAITVTFSPNSTGLESGTILLSDSTKTSPATIPLSGSGVNGPALTADPSRAIFPSQAVGTSSTPTPIMLVNSGNSGLNISGISVTGTDSADFTQTNHCGASLAPGGSCTINVTFTPTIGGSRTASLSISGTEPGSPLSVELAGTAIGPSANLSPTTLTFASQVVGTTSTAQTATLTNSGNAPLNIAGISASGEFAQTNTCGTSLAIGSSCQISVTFVPSAAGNASGTITVAQSGGGSPQTIALSGVGVAAADFTVGLASGSQASQAIAAGQNAQFSIAVAPAGSFTGAVNLSCSITPSATPAPSCNLSSTTVQLSGASQTVTVTISTAASTTASHSGLPFGGAPVAWAVLLGTLLPWRRKRALLMAITVIAYAGLSVIGCGGGGSSSSAHTTTTPGTPAGTYTATITAVSGSLSHNTSMTVVVQ
ncbi:MAG TPA: FG-GAP-like repeat-containing protein [Acidobacteriaceae bacterium]|nr:FG-GAP-like repeat-containing protein [Acidobacteriaceae bacterium]